MRPASHMPLAAMMMWKPVSFAIALLSSTVSVNRRCGEFKSRRDVDIRVEARRHVAENFGGADGERRIEKDRRRRHFAALHQIDKIDDQFLGAFDREGRDEQRALAACASRTSAASCARRALARDRRPVSVAVGGFGDDIVESRRRFRIGLQQLGVGADIAGGENAQRFPRWLFAGKLELDGGGPEQMSGVPIAGADARHHVDPCLVVDRRGRTAARRRHRPWCRSG